MPKDSQVLPPPSHWYFWYRLQHEQDFSFYLHAGVSHQSGYASTAVAEILMACTQECHELLSLDKDPKQHRLIPDQADSLKPFSHPTASTLSFQLLCSGLLQKKKYILVFTSPPTSANWDQLYPHLCSGGLANGVTQGFAIFPKFSCLLPEPSPTFWCFYSPQH